MVIYRKRGNHAKIAEWRRIKSLLITKERRPDIYNPTAEDIKILKKAGYKEETEI